MVRVFMDLLFIDYNNKENLYEVITGKRKVFDSDALISEI